MKRYDSYKDSGVVWIGQIPSGWKRTKLHILKCLGEIDYQDGNHGSVHPKSEDFTENGIPFLRPTDVFQNYISKLKLKYIPEEYVKKLRIGFTKQGDIIFVNRGNIGTTTILTGFDNFTNVIINPQLTYIRTKEKLVNSNYLFYQTQSNVFQSNRDLKLGNGSVLNFLGLSDLGDYEMVIPPLSEQQQIVSFLDTKTSLIDSLIEKTKRKIELLQEKRTSIINEVVTKGLNPNVEMKDSGVEWIGEIPNHWRSPFFGLISNLQQGLQIPFDERFFEKEEGMYEYITTKSVHRPNDPRQYVLNPKKTVVCNENEILYGRTGNTGEVITNVEGVFHNNFFKIEYDKNTLTKEYLIYQLTNSRFKETILILSGTTTIPDLNHGDFNSMRCLTPPISEQQQIVSYLDEQTQLIDKTISIEEKRIELLKEYRQSLISEVVTGKRKVV